MGNLLGKPPGLTDLAEGIDQGDANDVNKKSLVRMWIGELPRANASPPALVGQTTENSFVRVYIPVRPPGE